MDAKICDRCGELWKDDNFCNIKMKTLTLSKGLSHSDHIGSYDLCESCYNELFEYLKPVPQCENNSNE